MSVAQSSVGTSLGEKTVTAGIGSTWVMFDFPLDLATSSTAVASSLGNSRRGVPSGWMAKGSDQGSGQTSLTTRSWSTAE